MMKYIIVILLMFFSVLGKAQNNPSGFPTQLNTGWQRWGWSQSDSGVIIAPRIPNFTPRFPGTTIIYQQTGVDTSLHYWTGGRWIKLGENKLFGITDNTTTVNRQFDWAGFSFNNDSVNNYNIYTKVKSTGADAGVRHAIEINNNHINMWGYHSNNVSTRSYGFNAYPALTQMFAAGHVPGHATYVQSDTFQIILESDPYRLYMFHDSTFIGRIDGGVADVRIRTLPQTTDTSYNTLVSGPKGQIYLRPGGNSGGGGSGTVTSVALSMPSAFSVSGSPVTSSGTLSVSGAGTTAQYIRGNGTLATTDTGMIPNFHLKVRSLLSGASPITFNQTTGVIGINNANTSGTKGAASFTSSFSDNGSGLIDLADLVSAGSCTGCILNINAKGRITGYSDGPAGATNNVNIGDGFRILNSATQEIKTLFAGAGTSIDSVSNADGITLSSQNISNASLTADGTYAQNWNNKQWYVDSISGQFLFRMGGVGSTGTRRKDFRINWGGSSFGNNLDGYNIMTTINKADNSGDSLRLGLISSGTGVLSMGYYDVANSVNNTFISYSATSGLINISAKDSIWIKGAVPAATADSALGVINRGANGTGKIVKFPIVPGGVTSLNNIGAGFRWVATPGGNIKTAANSNTILWDSTSNANALTGKVDTSVIATQWDLIAAQQNIQTTLNYGDTSNRPIIYKFQEDTTDQRYTFVGIPSNYGVSYGAEGTQMGYASGWMRANYVNASGRPNVVYNMAMYNTSNGGGRISTSDAAYRFGLETHFNTGGQRLFEFHLPEMTTYAGAIFRPFTMYMNKETGATQFNYFATAGVDYQNTSGQGLLSFGGLGGLQVFGRTGNLSLLLQADDGNTYRELMLEGGGIQHLSYGGDQFFDSRTIFNNTNNNLPAVIVTDNRSASTVGLQVNIDGTSAAKYPIQIEANTTGGIVEDFENGTGPNELKVLGNGNALVTVNNISTTDPAGSGYNAAFSQWVTGSDYSFIGMNYGTSAGPYTGTQLFYRTVTSAPHVWYVGSAQMMRLNSTGFGIGTTDPLFGLHVNRSVGINKDSVTHRTTTGARQMLVLDTTTNSVERMDIPSSGGIATLNTLTASTQTFATGTSGSDFNISSSTSTHTFNIPSASTSNRGLVTTTSQTLGGQKTFNDGIVATSSTNSRITINGDVSVANGPSTYGDGLAIDFITHTNTSGAGTVSANQNFSFIANPTLTSSNAISYTGDVATIRFVGAPAAAGSTTISHPYNILANDVNYFAGIAMALNEQSVDVTIANASGVNVYTGAGGNTWTLPSLATHPGKFIFIKNAGAGNLTVQRAGSDNIYNTSSVTSITVAAGADVVLAAGSSFWYVIGM